MDMIERGDLPGQKISMAVVSQTSPHSTPSVIEAQLSKINPTAEQPRRAITKPAELLPWTFRFDRWGFSTQLVSLPRGKGTSYRAAVHISLFGKIYSVRLFKRGPGFSFDRAWRVCNIVPADSDMAVACSMGDFDRARILLTGGLAHGSDMNAPGWPMLDVSVEKKKAPNSKRAI